jgi:hypothetical protein
MLTVKRNHQSDYASYDLRNASIGFKTVIDLVQDVELSD